MYNLKYLKIFFLSGIVFILLFTLGCSVKNANTYGVFLGIGSNEIDKLDNYTQVVIEPTEFTKEHITNLHNEGKTIYGYINIGALEEYRPYFAQFKNITLSTYEDWPDERWVDVSSKYWQEFIVNELGKKYFDMGFDGFFLDNADVYYHYPNDNIFQGLCNILSGLKQYNIPLILNGGDRFVSKCIDQNINLFDGINQESVFTNAEQSIEITDYYKEYLMKVKKKHLTVYLLEYNANKSLSKQINTYCHKNGFIWYNANGLDLK